ncbi:DUF4116 domain-containing protein [uncultured Fusobacterium sp.]|jgi:ribosomal protein L4|uniref:DUF4116 domain-containing protein n=1 Tax=uncultured Fusobacterium sp. TaxID=159267 RepID=UPI0025E465C7|nr:DUF4116 domain-containing protein [uncultured Fusobacterium sp.]
MKNILKKIIGFMKNNEKEMILEKIENFEIKSKKDGQLNYILNDPYILKDLPEKFKNDEDVVIAAAKKYYGNLKYASDELKNNKKFILRAINELNQDSYFGEIQEAYFLNYLSEELKNDDEIVKAAIKKNRENLKYASERLQKSLLEAKAI